jgi:hypothetical protein
MSSDPYASPETSAASATPPAIAKKPSRLIVFGILHIVGAVIGLGGLIVNFAQGDPKEAFTEAFKQPGVNVIISEDALNALDPIFKYQQPLAIAGLVIAVLLLLSGIGLLMSTSWSLKLSNIYSTLSLIMKVVAIILAVTLFAPAYNKFFDSITGMDETMLSIMKGSVIGGLFAPLLIAIYPILSFILLNKKVVKDHLGVS